MQYIGVMVISEVSDALSYDLSLLITSIIADQSENSSRANWIGFTNPYVNCLSPEQVRSRIMQVLSESDAK